MNARYNRAVCLLNPAGWTNSDLIRNGPVAIREVLCGVLSPFEDCCH